MPITNAKAWPLEGEVYVPSDYEIMEPDEDWHPIATNLYCDALRSGQCYYYEASEYALLYMLCENISRDMKPQVIGVHPETGRVMRAKQSIRGTSLNAYNKLMQDLMMTEAARRRIHVELIRGFENQEVDPRVRTLQSLKDRLAG
jgi:hypothetical protein